MRDALQRFAKFLDQMVTGIETPIYPAEQLQLADMAYRIKDMTFLPTPQQIEDSQVLFDYAMLNRWEIKFYLAGNYN